MKKWRALGPAYPGGPSHSYPLDDLREHDVDGDNCWCRPTLNGIVLVHNSLDGREIRERAEVSAKAAKN